jgi:hypothetical protein
MISSIPLERTIILAYYQKVQVQIEIVVNCI